jgi:hypothetical protein
LENIAPDLSPETLKSNQSVMKYIFILTIILCGLWPCFAPAQIGDVASATGNTSIAFYGRVVDQEGNSLVGAKVTLNVLAAYMSSPAQVAMKEDKTTFMSDINGCFALTGTVGQSVKIEAIQKEGYELSHTISRLYPCVWPGGVAHFESNNPVLFVLWRNGMEQALITGENYYEFIPDGRFYAVDFEKRTIAPATNSEGDFQFCLTRPIRIGNLNKFDWSFSFRGQVGNTLQETPQRFFEMAFAPKAKFTNSYEESYEASKPGWKRGGKAQLFIKMHDAHSYGRVAIKWDTVAAANGPKTNEAGIHIQYTINPTGSALAE